MLGSPKVWGSTSTAFLPVVSHPIMADIYDYSFSFTIALLPSLHLCASAQKIGQVLKYTPNFCCSQIHLLISQPYASWKLINPENAPREETMDLNLLLSQLLSVFLVAAPPVALILVLLSHARRLSKIENRLAELEAESHKRFSS